MLYKGNCHCGRVAYEVEGEIGGVIEHKLEVQPFDGRAL